MIFSLKRKAYLFMKRLKKKIEDIIVDVVCSFFEFKGTQAWMFYISVGINLLILYVFVCAIRW